LIIILVLAQFMAFIVMVFVLIYLLRSMSYKETNRLQQLNDDNVQKSKELAKKIIDAENEYKEKMTKCEDETRKMKADARKEIEELKEAMIAKGKAESEHMIAQAINTKKELRAEVESEMYGKSIDISCKIFQKVLSSTEQKLVFDGFLENVFQELTAIEKDHLQAVDLGEGSESTVDVKSSHPMSPQQKSRLEKILSSKLDHTIVVQEEIDTQVVSGIVIQLGSIVIDGSLSEKFRKAAEELK